MSLRNWVPPSSEKTDYIHWATFLAVPSMKYFRHIQCTPFWYAKILSHILRASTH